MPVAFRVNLNSVRVQTALVIGLTAIVLVSVLSALLSQSMAFQLHRDKGNALAVMARSIAHTLERDMSEGRRQIVALAGSDELWRNGLDSEPVRHALNRTRRSQTHAAWVGVADIDGVVRGAADDLLLGRNVSDRPWFRNGRDATFVGDVHPTQLLANLLPRGADGEPVRLVDFSTPIRRGGRTIGVVGVRNSWDWAGQVVAEFVPKDNGHQVEVFIQGRDGQFLYSSVRDASVDPELVQNAAEAGVLGQACDVCDSALDLRWNDERIYLTAASDLPRQGADLDLGWRVVVRQPAPVAYAHARQAALAVLGIGLVVAALAVAIAWSMSGYLSAPLVRLAHAASAVERGERDARIPRLTENSELVDLSATLAGMTDRLLQAKLELEHRVEERTTELQATNLRLHRLSVEQQAMLDNDLVGIVRVRDRKAVWMNRAIERMFGYAPDELLGRSSRLLFADQQTWLAAGLEAEEVLRAGGRCSLQQPMRRKNGDRIWVNLNGTRLSAETGETLWLMTDITALKDQQTQIEHIAFHDTLTGLPNRLLLADRLHQALTLNERLHRRVALCCLDLDGFKAVNDTLGHAAGDEVLKEVARRLLTCVRSSDTVTRLGGDEFVIVLTPLEGRTEAETVALRVLDAVGQPIELAQGRRAQVTASIGVALSPDHGSHATRLMKLADAAMYEAKYGGKCQVRFHQPVVGAVHA